MLKKQKYKFISLILSIFFILSSITMIYPVQKAYASNLAQALETAPLNPAFLDYQAKAKQPSNESEDQSLNTHPLGAIPSPFILPNHNPEKKLNTTSQSPTSFPTSYDLRQTNKLTDVRDQSTSGSCWAFAALGSLESTLMPSEKQDFSENNLKNNSGFDLGPNDGGMPTMSMAYLSRWDGPVSEADDPFDPESTSSPKKQPQKHVQEALTFGYTDQSYSDIKNMLMNNGAVETRMYWNSSYFNPTKNSYYYDGSSNINHEVVIVGWNDNYPKENFLITPETNGAFIVRNSWGTEWGDNGYFYVSYWDMQIANDNTVFNNAESTTNYGTAYQYDPLGWTGSLGGGTDTAWIANVFTSTSTEPLSAISFYTPVPNSTYEIRVYNDFTGTFTAKTPIKAGTIGMAGYHTINLGTSIPVKTGEKFAVSVKLITPNYTYPIPIEKPIADYSSKATASPGQSYVSLDGANWADLTLVNGCLNTNVCLKVFTTNQGNVVPAQVQDLKVNSTSTNQVNLGWSAVSGAVSYTIYRSLSSTGTFAAVGTTTSPTVSYSDQNLTAATTYYYKVCASNASGEGPQSSIVTATTLSGTNGVISGIIKNASGTPLPGVFIMAESVNSSAPANAVAFSSGLTKTLESKSFNSKNLLTKSINYYAYSNADGTYTLNVLPGNYILFLWPDPVNSIDYAYQYYDNELGPTTAHVTQVASGETNTINPTLAVGGRMSGIVTDSNGIGLSGIEVMAYNQYGLGVGTDTDSTGHYEILGMAATSYKVEFDPTDYNASHGTNYAKQWYNNQPSESSATSVAVATGQKVANINAQFQGSTNGGVISGKIINASGVQLSGVRVTATNLEDESIKITEFSKTDGTYTMNLTAGNYILSYWADPINGIDYGYQYYNNKLGPVTADIVQVVDGQGKTINVTMAVGGNLSGFVTGADGTGLEGIKITAFNRYGVSVSSETNSNGHYEIRGMAATTYKVEFDPTKYNAIHGTNYALQWYNKNSLAVAAGQSLANINAQLQSPSSIPGTPTGLTGTSPNSNQIDLSWNNVSGAASYNVYRATKANGKFTKIASSTIGSCTISNLRPNTTYYFKVSTVNTQGEGLQSSVVNVTTKGTVPAKVQGLTAKNTGTNQVDLKWRVVKGATSYKIYRSTSILGAFTEIGISSMVSYSDKNLTEATTYYYNVSALNANGEGSPSSVVKASIKASNVSIINLVKAKWSSLSMNQIAQETNVN